MNTNSNSYTIIYASVMVVIVAFLLSFVSSTLKEQQDENIRLDKKKQILSALNINDVQDAAAEYAKYVKADPILDAEGNEVKAEGGFDAAKDENALFVCEVEGATKYIIPLNGNGLWGAIWGYIALNDDKSSVYGIYFNHASETPGLGAEIVKDAFKQPFIGKNIKRNGALTSIAVVKKGQSAEESDYVDGVSGGTITSTAVSDMLKSCLSNYEKFLTKTAAAQPADTTATSVEAAEVVEAVVE